MKLTRLTAAAAAFSFLVVGVAGPAVAADDTNVTVTGGTLAITAAPTASNFTGVTLDGTAKTTTAALAAFEVNDARGTGAGWNVTIAGTAFAEHSGTAYVASGKTLANGSLDIAVPTVAQDGTTSAVPTMTGGTVDGTTRKIASAAVDTGMGKFDVGAAALTLSIPASAYAKSYRSDLTISVNTGP